MYDNNKLVTQYLLLKMFGGSKQKKWKTLNHNGVLFPPLYVYQKIPLIYNKKRTG